MDSTTPVLAALDALLASVKSTTLTLTYPSIPVTSFFRAKDIGLFKAEVSRLVPVLQSLRSRHLALPSDLETQLIEVLLACDTVRAESLFLLSKDDSEDDDVEDGEHARHRSEESLSSSPSKQKVYRASWMLCLHRDNAFLLRHRLMQYRCVLEATLAIANLLSLKAIARTAMFSRAAVKDISDQLAALKRALTQVMGGNPANFEVKEFGLVNEGQKVDGAAFLRRGLVAVRAAVHDPRDLGVTGPSSELIMFVDRLLVEGIREGW
ncbi:uncharacterized protein AB675_6548 [Cyphellophora attinorum]|uniref:Uncharacterized protein n=1 Tax=Cyphellophora attinorum TaxID=1664694 RepID=A0A0N0NQB1_9EURO|nr:uncharacterized protein AB675_6548 [Phialophora attinorum]KPI43701.1 hypothetical protein AB675_6548 [Phialophora attinorum]